MFFVTEICDKLFVRKCDFKFFIFWCPINDRLWDNQAFYERMVVVRKVVKRNNIFEHDHRCIKRKMRQAMGFFSMRTAEKTIAGIETMHQLRKGQVPFIDGKKDPQCCRNFIHRCFGITGPIFPTILNRPCPLSVS